MLIKRSIEPKIKKLSKGFPVLSVSGPRQSGKTTLVKNFFEKYKYTNLENLDTLAYVERNPANFIKENTKLIIDEVQRYGDLLSYIQVTVDERKKMADYIISGSQNLLISDKISQSLAGRAAYLTLLPFSLQELEGTKLTKTSLTEQIFTGFYPAIYDRNIDPIDYFNEYIRTYVERDVRQLVNIQNLTHFRKFLGLLAGRIGQLVNLTSLANDVGVTHNTIEGWISILEASYIIFRLPPYHENLGKRLIKAPKIYFYDTGLACRLLNLTTHNALERFYLIGGLYENMIIADTIKHITNESKSAKLYFYRDSSGRELDLLIDNGINKIPVEIKSSGTFNKDFMKHIDYWNSLKQVKQDDKKDGAIIYTGDLIDNTNDTKITNWKNLEVLFEMIE